MRTALLCIALLLACFVAKAQGWEVDLSRDGSLPAVWQGDLEDYTVRSGAIHLKAREGRRSSFIKTNIQLGEDNSWQGVIKVNALPTSQNYTYILLAKISEQGATSRHLALAFGAKYNAIVLCETTLIKEGTGYRLDSSRDNILIHSHRLPVRLLTGLSYQVTFGKDGTLLLYLSEEDPEKADLVDQVEYDATLPKSNELIVYNAYTSRQPVGMSLSNLRLIPEANFVEGDPTEGGSEEEKPQETFEATSFLLSEIMANPKEGSTEYIELYHSGDVSASLADYSLGLGHTKSEIKLYPMSRLKTLYHPDSYIVITTNPDALKATYPDVDETALVKGKLPQLRNAGFVLQLYKGKTLVDECVYDPESFGKGLKTKRGVSYERTVMAEGKGEWQTALKDNGYATPTRPNSRTISTSSPNQDASDKQGRSLTELIQSLEENANDVELRLVVYDLLGNKQSEASATNGVEILRNLLSQPYTTLQSLSASKVGILVVYLRGASGDEKVYDLKYSLAHR